MVVLSLSALQPPMFLLNSRPPLVTATSCRAAGTPYPEVTGLICRIPSARLYPTRLGLLTQRHLCRFSVRSPRIPIPNSFFMGTRDRPKTPYGVPILLSTGSRHYGSPRSYTVGRSDSYGRPTPIRQELGLCCHRYLGGTGILTCYPFPLSG